MSVELAQQLYDHRQSLIKKNELKNDKRNEIVKQFIAGESIKKLASENEFYDTEVKIMTLLEYVHRQGLKFNKDYIKGNSIINTVPGLNLTVQEFNILRALFKKQKSKTHNKQPPSLATAAAIDESP